MLKEKISLGVSLLLVLSSLFNSCSQNDNSETVYLQKVLSKLSKIKSASYYLTQVSTAPGDTIKFSEPRTQFIKTFINPSDTLVGASSAKFANDDTTKMIDFYDGMVKGKVNWEKQFVKVDSFKNHPYPFRLVYYPFYTKILEIIKYSLTTKDSIKTEFHDYGDSVLFKLKIYNKHVYFHIKPIVIKNDYIPDDEISKFDIWFHKSNNLPYRLKSKWSHLTIYETCINVKFNIAPKVDFIPAKHFPEYFEVVQFKRENRKPNNNLKGEHAPGWILKNTESNPIGLKDIKSKIILIQFTGVGCGPCHHSLPFLKQLVRDYKNRDFEFLAIETWSKNISGLKRYQDRNDFNFKFLMSTKEVTDNYQVQSVPIFFILDENRVIKNIVRGYTKGVTDKRIRKIINELI